MIKDGETYWIKSIQSGKCLDICQDDNNKRGTAILYNYCAVSNQQFVVKKNENAYNLFSCQTGKALTSEGNENGSIVR